MPIDSPDNRYGQINTPIQKDPYLIAGIKGFKPVQPFKAQTYATIAMTDENEGTQFPSLAELNAECFDWYPGEETEVLANDLLNATIEIFAVT